MSRNMDRGFEGLQRSLLKECVSLLTLSWWILNDFSSFEASVQLHTQCVTFSPNVSTSDTRTKKVSERVKRSLASKIHLSF